jgi:hypothetical protein
VLTGSSLSQGKLAALLTIFMNGGLLVLLSHQRLHPTCRALMMDNTPLTFIPLIPLISGAMQLTGAFGFNTTVAMIYQGRVLLRIHTFFAHLTPLPHMPSATNFFLSIGFSPSPIQTLISMVHLTLPPSMAGKVGIGYVKLIGMSSIPKHHVSQPTPTG